MVAHSYVIPGAVRPVSSLAISGQGRHVGPDPAGCPVPSFLSLRPNFGRVQPDTTSVAARMPASANRLPYRDVLRNTT
jgi:hypothetical protein